jgi:hypothetical protein
MTTDEPRSTPGSTTRRRSGPSPTRGVGRSDRPGAATTLALTGAAIGGGLALVGLMAASARSAATAPDGGVAEPATATAEGRSIVVRRIVLPPGAVGDPALLPPPSPPTATTRTAPVTRSHGS